ncbi:MAG: uracil-DNA glycosylase, partial [Bacteroidota bacterium]|nr:uracil-DNA glycosylase [Bacteroidota bacterium]
MNVQIEAGWKKVLEAEFNKPYFLQIVHFLKTEKNIGKTIYPPGSQIFNAFEISPFEKTKLVLLGQDPYHGPGQAHGLSFSVPDGVRPPPSLQNIFKELLTDTGMAIPNTGNLTPWARQGALLLNAYLTVESQNPMSHSQIGWGEFTNTVIKKLSDLKKNLIFLLWG